MKKIMSYGFVAAICCGIGLMGCQFEGEASTQVDPVECGTGGAGGAGGCVCEMPDPCNDAIPGAIVQDSTLCTQVVCHNDGLGIDPYKVAVNKPDYTNCWFTQGPHANVVGQCIGSVCAACEGHGLGDIWAGEDKYCTYKECVNDMGLGMTVVKNKAAGTACNEGLGASTCDGNGDCI